MATAVSEFIGDIRLHARGVPTPLIESVIRKAAIEFCEKTRIWKEEQEDIITTVDGTAEYTIAASTSGAEVAGIVELHFDDDSDTEIPPKTEKELRSLSPGWRIEEDKPVNFIHKDLTTVRMYPIPDDAYDVDGTLWIKPAKAGTTLPNILYNEWHDEIGYGALARILVLPQKWKDLEMAGYFKGEFEKAIKMAHSQVARQRTIGSATIRPTSVYEM